MLATHHLEDALDDSLLPPVSRQHQAQPDAKEDPHRTLVPPLFPWAQEGISLDALYARLVRPTRGGEVRRNVISLIASQTDSGFVTMDWYPFCLKRGQIYILAARGHGNNYHQFDRLHNDKVLAAAFVRYEGSTAKSDAEVVEMERVGREKIEDLQALLDAVRESPPVFEPGEDDGDYDERYTAHREQIDALETGLRGERLRWRYSCRTRTFRQLDTGMLHDVDLHGTWAGQRVGTMDVYVDVFPILGSMWVKRAGHFDVGEIAALQKKASLEVRGYTQSAAARIIQRHWRHARANPGKHLGWKRLQEEYAEMNYDE